MSVDFTSRFKQYPDNIRPVVHLKVSKRKSHDATLGTSFLIVVLHADDRTLNPVIFGRCDWQLTVF